MVRVRKRLKDEGDLVILVLEKREVGGYTTCQFIPYIIVEIGSTVAPIIKKAEKTPWNPSKLIS